MLQHKEKLKISIITPSFNQVGFIERNIQSVLNQGYENFEHIIIDGGSNDGTIEILKNYPHLVWVSEKDKGQAHALNKGLKMASGDVLGWINSDDYYEENIFSEIEDAFRDNNVDWLVGNLNDVNHNKKTTTKIVSEKISYQALLKNPDIVKQPCTFYRTNLIRKVGGWNNDLYMIMDYDLWLRISKHFDPKMINITLANFVTHPNQKTNPKNIKKQISEIEYVLKREGEPKSDVWKILFKKYKSYYKKKVKGLVTK